MKVRSVVLLVAPSPLVLAALAASCGGGTSPVDAGVDGDAAPPAMEAGPDAGARCPTWSELKNPYFGDLHEHTSYSADAYTFATRNTPVDAYAFARGKPLQIAGAAADGGGPVVKIDRPLDFLAVTDHSEFLSIAFGCGADLQGTPYDPSSPYFGTPRCQLFRSTSPQVQGLNFALLLNNVRTLCDAGACEPVIRSAWQKEQQAAALAYEPCTFTSFVAYEWTHMGPSGETLHKNVIFASEKVPERPYDSLAYSTQTSLWGALDMGCKPEAGCEAITIPHNSNMSDGLAFEVPPGAEAQMAKYQRLVEIFQHKGGSECFHADGGPDPDCAFEQLDGAIAPPNPQSYVRSGLAAGLARRKGTGQNPLEMGFVGATDDHDGTPGNVSESTYPGHVGRIDDRPGARLYEADGGRGENASFNPGGLTGVWAEQNTRDRVFAALKRRETWATSGPRIVVRFFQTRADGTDPCADPDFPRALVAKGAVPMGGTFAASGGKPRFVAYAWKDQTDLARVDLVKGWIDGGGQPREEVRSVTIADASKPACIVWDDASYAGEVAFWYARVLERPTPRWSTYDCQKAPQANPAGCAQGGWLAVDVQERAWTSPIWATP